MPITYVLFHGRSQQSQNNQPNVTWSFLGRDCMCFYYFIVCWLLLYVWTMIITKIKIYRIYNECVAWPLIRLVNVYCHYCVVVYSCDSHPCRNDFFKFFSCYSEHELIVENRILPYVCIRSLVNFSFYQKYNFLLQIYEWLSCIVCFVHQWLKL